MVILRPNQLPAATTPLAATDLVVVDQGAGGVNAADPQDVVDAAAPVASQAEAEAGSDNSKRMTSLRTKQSIASEVGATIASAAQGALASTAVQPSRQVIAGNGLTGGGALSADVTINVGAGTGIDVAANSVGLDATTQSRLLIGGGTTSQVLQKSSNTDYDVSWVTVAAATAVSYAPQTLTSPEQLQARTNIGLSNVDNTSDANKPVSTAQQTAINSASYPASGISFPGRLSLTSGIAITTTDVTAASTLYWVPYGGSLVWLYTGSAWVSFAQAQLSISLAGATASRPHDVFMDYNGGTPALALTAWTNDTTRATALTTQNGILVKTGATTQRYLGTIYVNASNQCEDGNARRWVWNMYNRRLRSMRVLETTDTWNYTTNTIRQANGSTANQLDIVRGLDEDAITARVDAGATNGTVPCGINVYIGLDSTSAIASGSTYAYAELQTANRFITASAQYIGLPGIGRHFLAWLERSNATGTTTWYGDGGGTVIQGGITGQVLA
jgi:hypothetical protein